MRVEAVARLDDRRIGQRVVDLRYPRIGPVVEAAVGGDRAVDPVDEPHVGAGEATEPTEVEVERVEQADIRAVRDAIQLDGESAPLELSEERAQELVTAAGRRRRELVEEREICTSSSGPQEIRLRPELARDGAEPASHPEDGPACRHAARARSAAADRRRPSSSV